MSDADQQIIMGHCAKFLETLGVPGLLIFSYQDGPTVRMVKTKKDVHPKAELQLIMYALKEAQDAILWQDLPPETKTGLEDEGI